MADQRIERRLSNVLARRFDIGEPYFECSRYLVAAGAADRVVELTLDQVAPRLTEEGRLRA